MLLLGAHLMMTYNNVTSVTQPVILVFHSESYEFWIIKMTLFRSQDLWDLIENGYSDGDDEKVKLKKNQTRDSKALL